MRVRLPNPSAPRRRKADGERDAAEGLDAILPHHRDQPGKAILAFNVVHDQALLGFPHQSCRRLIDRQLQTFLDRAGFRRHQDMQAHDVARRIVQQDVDVVERNHGRQPLGEIANEIVQVAVRGDRFGHLEQQAKTIAFLAQLLLHGSRAFLVQHVVDGNGNLLDHQVQEIELQLVECVRPHAPEAHRPKRMHARRQREHAERFDAELLHQRPRDGEPPRLIAMTDDNGLLRRERESTERRVDRHFQPGRDSITIRAPEHVHAHHILVGIVQVQRDHLERDDGRQSPGEIAKERRQVSMRGDGFRDLHQQTQPISAADTRLGNTR